MSDHCLAVRNYWRLCYLKPRPPPPYTHTHAHKHTHSTHIRAQTFTLPLIQFPLSPPSPPHFCSTSGSTFPGPSLTIFNSSVQSMSHLQCVLWWIAHICKKWQGPVINCSSKNDYNLIKKINHGWRVWRENLTMTLPLSNLPVVKVISSSCTLPPCSSSHSLHNFHLPQCSTI